MAKEATQEKFKTMIGGQALIEGILMRGPEKQAVVVRTKDGLQTKIEDVKKPNRIPIVRGVLNFGASMVSGMRALLFSANFFAEDTDEAEEPSKFEKWLEKKLGSEKLESVLVTFAAVLGVLMSVGLFFLLPMLIGSVFMRWIDSTIAVNLLEGVVRIAIFLLYMILVSRMEDMRRVFSYHGAEHKTIRCYEARLPLTVENVREQTRMHPRCGTSFLFVVMLISILVFSVVSELLLQWIPSLDALRESSALLYKALMIVIKLATLPLVVSISYEINRFVGKHDNALTRILTAPGLWFQRFTTNEPDDSMIEVAIEALTLVLPKEEGSDLW